MGAEEKNKGFTMAGHAAEELFLNLKPHTVLKSSMYVKPST